MVWQPQMIAFMNQLIRAYPSITAKEIAERLSVKFKRKISRNAVVGKTWRDRRSSK